MIQILFLFIICTPLLVVPLLIGLMGHRRTKRLSFFLGIGAFVIYFIVLSFIAVSISLGDSPSYSENSWDYICFWYEQHAIALEVIALISTIIMTGSLSLLLFDLGKFFLLLAKHKYSIKAINLQLVALVLLGLIMAAPIWWLYGVGFFQII